MTTWFGELIAQLGARDLAIIDDAVPAALLDGLCEELAARRASGAFRPAKVGRGHASERRPEIRDDLISWLRDAPPSPAVEGWHAVIDALREELRAAFRISLRSYRGHFAIYEPGGHYDRHVDQFRATSNRILSTVLYLNRGWVPEDGGELRVWLGDERLDIAPKAGRFLCFRSELVPHEVLETRRERWSIAGWLRRDEVFQVQLS